MRFLTAVAIASVTSFPVAAQQTTRPAGQRVPRAGGIPGSELVVVVTDSQCDSPAEVDAGLVNIRLFNRGTVPHHALVIKVDRLERTPQIEELLRSSSWDVPWIHPMGGPDAIAPGGVSSASVVLEPGRYLIACVSSTPTQGRLHFKGGVLRDLAVVTGIESRRATLPPAEITVQMNEWGFGVVAPMPAGRRTIRIQNDGQFEHHAWFVRLLPGKTIAQAARWVDSPSTAPPFEGVGGTRAIDSGAAVNVTLDLIPGEYAILCTLYNPLSKKTHAAHGMVTGFTVQP